MSAPDDEFDDFLRRRRPIFGRPGDDLEPPAELDRLVLRQAREAIEAEKPQRVFRAPSWGMPVALAATLVLALTIILRVGMPAKEASPEVTVRNVARTVEYPAPSAVAPASAPAAAPAQSAQPAQRPRFRMDPSWWTSPNRARRCRPLLPAVPTRSPTLHGREPRPSSCRSRRRPVFGARGIFPRPHRLDRQRQGRSARTRMAARTEDLARGDRTPARSGRGRSRRCRARGIQAPASRLRGRARPIKARVRSPLGGASC